MRAERGEDARREYVRACVFGQRTLARPSSVGSVNVQQYHSVVRVQYTTHTTAAAQVHVFVHVKLKHVTWAAAVQLSMWVAHLPANGQVSIAA